MKVKFLIVRKIFFPIFRKFSFKFKFRHFYTGRSFRVDFFEHKGYWYFPRLRERKLYGVFEKSIGKGDTVLDVGAHIGFLSVIFEELVGETGVVISVEASSKNLELLRENTNGAITDVVDCVVSDRNGEIDFFIDAFGGFTNSTNFGFVERQNNILGISQALKNPQLKRVRMHSRTIDDITKKFKL